MKGYAISSNNFKNFDIFREIGGEVFSGIVFRIFSENLFREAFRYP